MGKESKKEWRYINIYVYIYHIYVCVCVCVHGGGNGNLLQYSCQENLVDRGAWQVTVHGVAKSWT